MLEQLHGMLIYNLVIMKLLLQRDLQWYSCIIIHWIFSVSHLQIINAIVSCFSFCKMKKKWKNGWWFQYCCYKITWIFQKTILHIFCFRFAEIMEAKRNPLQSWTKICRYVVDLNVNDISSCYSHGQKCADMLMIWMSMKFDYFEIKE